MAPDTRDSLLCERPRKLPLTLVLDIAVRVVQRTKGGCRWRPGMRSRRCCPEADLTLRRATSASEWA